MLLAMEEELRNKLNQISGVMSNFDLETTKIATIQADLVVVTGENTKLRENITTLTQTVTTLTQTVTTLEQENINLNGRVTTLTQKVTSLDQENINLKGELSTVKGELSTLKLENTDLKTNVDKLLKDVNILMSKVGQGTSEGEPDFAAGKKELDVDKGANEPDGETDFASGKKELVDKGEVNFIGGTNEPDGEPDVAGGKEEPVDKGEVNLACGSNVGDVAIKEVNLAGGKPQNTKRRKPKTQRKREQNEIFGKWRKTMAQRKTAEHLWASGYLKLTMELWEDGIYMDEEQILDFFKRNVEQLTTFISSAESKESFFLTVNKMCSMRNVSKPKFEEIMQCLLNHGPQRARITEPEVQKFIKMYKE